MRNYFNAVMLGLLLMGCSVDNDETNFNNDQLLTANSVLEVDGCESVNYKLFNSADNALGEFVITNDKDNLYLNFAAVDGLLINEIVWEVALDESQLPINNGGVIAGQLDHKMKFTSGTKSYDVTIPLSDFGDFENLTDFVVAAKVNYTNSLQQEFSVWVGDQMVGKKGSKILVYTICVPQEEPVCVAYAGADNSVTYTKRQVDAIVDTAEDVENLYKGLLEDGVSRSGTFNPTIKAILNSYYTVSKYQDFKTIYTVTNELNGEMCSDSVELTLTITR